MRGLSKRIDLLTILSFQITIFIAFVFVQIIPRWHDLFQAGARELVFLHLFDWTLINQTMGYLVYVYPIIILIQFLPLKKMLLKNSVDVENKGIFFLLVKYSIRSAVVFTISHILFYLLFSYVSPYDTNIMTQYTGLITKFMINERMFGNSILLMLIGSSILNDLPIMFFYSYLIGIFTVLSKNSIYWFIVLPYLFVACNSIFLKLVPLDYFDLTTPLLGYCSKIDEIWKYCVLPASCSCIWIISIVLKMKKGKDHS